MLKSLNVIAILIRKLCHYSSDINPSRRGESSMSERFSVESIYENDFHNNYKASETQTSPEFVKASRRNAKKLIKLEKEKSIRNERIEREENRDIEQTFAQTLDNQLLSPSPHLLERNKSTKNTNERTKKTKPFENIDTNYTVNVNQSNILTKSNPLIEKETDSTRREVLQEYAETLLRETALMVQSDNIRRDSFKKNKMENMNLKHPLNSYDRKIQINPISKSESKTAFKISNKIDNYSNKIINNGNNSRENDIEEVPNPHLTLPKSNLIENVGDSSNLEAINHSVDRNSKPPPHKKAESQSVNSKFKRHSEDMNNFPFITESLNKPSDNLRKGINIPNKFLKLKWMYPFFY